MRIIALSLLLLSSAFTAGAAPVAVTNPGFEDLYLGSNLPPQYGGDVPTGAFPTGPAPAGWTLYTENGVPVGGASVGVLNPGTTADHAPDPPCFPAGAPEGDNVVLLFMNGAAGGNEFGVEQQLGETLQAHTTYTLTVEVGDIASCAGLVAPYTSFFDLQGFPGYRVQLLAGAQLVVEDAGALSPGDGFFETATLQITTGSQPLGEGQPLLIRLVSRNQPDVPGVSGLEVDFDDVRLDATPAPQLAPVPPAAGWLAGLALAGLAVARLRHRSSR